MLIQSCLCLYVTISVYDVAMLIVYAFGDWFVFDAKSFPFSEILIFFVNIY